jgi:hypothetical protein
MRITFVKKIKADGLPCRKCTEVEERLAKRKITDRIDRVVVADEANPNSEGMALAEKYKVSQAPFFLVEDASGSVQVYTSFLRLAKEVLQEACSEKEENEEIADRISHYL